MSARFHRRPGSPLANKWAAIEPDHPAPPMARQCQLLGLARASYHYRPLDESTAELVLLRRLHEQYTRTPFYEVRRMTAVLRQQGYAVSPKAGAPPAADAGPDGLGRPAGHEPGGTGAPGLSASAAGSGD